MTGNLRQNTISVLSDSIKTFVIVIRDNEASEYYYSNIEHSWTDYGFVLERFNAITPANLSSCNELSFGLCKSQKYTSIKMKKEFAVTEKAVWNSHYSLWKKCVELDEPILVLEHDTMLMNRDTLKLYDQVEFITFDNSFGCYYITPKFASALVERATRKPIEVGPYGFVHQTASLLSKDIITSEDSRFQKSVVQVLSRKYDRTNDRYSTEDLKFVSAAFNNNQERIELFKNNYKFLMIP